MKFLTSRAAGADCGPGTAYFGVSGRDGRKRGRDRGVGGCDLVVDSHDFAF